MSSGRRRGRPRHPDVLTPAEWRVVDAVRHGMANRQIARRRGVSLDAVKFHIANALDKLGLDGRAQLRRWAGVPADSHLRPPSRGGSLVDGELHLGSIGQISRVVSDIPRAVEWYGGVLGLPHLYTFGDLAFFDCAGTRLFLSLPESGGVPKDQAVLYFRVPDIHAAHDHLTAKGVSFEGAPHMIHRHESGTEEWMAFFTDPDGGLLAIMSQCPPAA
ncbi:VOC family protein [Dactylosporangium roseum]|uniref:VOC family protein n=1 Tax=Dactylosporangium roseum TaxID=47989 RepID=A0ABY5ZB20_9ACTN|nr:VOC family protein [Dactylosporangium roseum]UWZ39221.1 VOC family protein [Dactylosporangium roseum]